MDDLLHRLSRCRAGMAALEFVFLAPALLMLVFSIIVYSLYFAAYFGVRQAASEGARTALAGLSSDERISLATTRAQEIVDSYGNLLGSGKDAVITTSTDGANAFMVTVSYDISDSPIMRYASILPLPATDMKASATVTNGGY
ncbi:MULTISPECIES: TadE/TadG family type IV pilus assembly protein [unclassified Novosphingobium]|uniref:TadE/TadG family type IV pilus assembly protein n=1 Tax=unclassified Novosphingobium TaxID=2644732 RepID=UPI00020EFBE1|nr:MULTISPECIES: TadE/TadG family type IV pilus assembly protein [unclassified Novosphingobium]GFM31494.1 TadE family protein [Novosphingobium sp. PY1]CCA90421.1 TadE family protein [Novosphingobium sp. PP1Y]